MRSEKPNVVEMAVDVQTVGGGEVGFKTSDGRVFALPATMIFEQTAGRSVYRRIVLRVEMLTLEEKPLE